jgi:hypothetical protein
MNNFFAIEMKSKPSTSTAKDEDVMDTADKPGTEVVGEKGSRGQKRKSEDAGSEETSSKKVSYKSLLNHNRTAT